VIPEYAVAAVTLGAIQCGIGLLKEALSLPNGVSVVIVKSRNAATEPCQEGAVLSLGAVIGQEGQNGEGHPLQTR